MEMIDVCDSLGQQTGQVLPRDVVHRDGLWHHTVHLWILNSENQFLLQQRSMMKESNPGQWDVSAAGHVSAGQELKEAAVRELEEELGLVVIEDEIEFLFQVKHQSQEEAYIENEFQSVFVWRGDVELKSLVCDPDEVAAVAWIDAEKLFELAKARQPELVQHEDEYLRLETWWRGL
jgi:isopentenyldiphosphate isomerase